MLECVITFRSVTPAQRGMAVLKREGFYCTLSRTPKWMEEQGCGYSLRVRYSQVHECIQKLRQENVSFRRIYLLRQGGNAEELEL